MLNIYKEKTSLPKNKHKNLFQYIISQDNIDNAYCKSQLGQMKYKRGAIIFSQNLTVNLNNLRQRIINGVYYPSEYHEFKVYEPKERLIYAPSFEDKIVQHIINNILKDIYRPCFIYDSYSCIEDKGTHACVDRIQTFIRQAKRNYGQDSYIIKTDIAKFFYSIDRKILKRLFRKKISCLDTLRLLDIVVDSSPNDIGLPLGNLTSQLFANIYLNELDQFCKRKLRLKYYVRYADDIVIIINTKDQAREVLEKIKVYTSNILKLNLHTKKTKIFPLSQGVNSVGFKIHPTYRLLRNDCKKKIKRKIRKMPHLIQDGKMTVEKANQILGSWSGHAKHGNSRNFIINILKKSEYLSLTNKYLLKTNQKINIQS